MNRSIFDLKDRIIIVTGGSGRLGQEYCRYLRGQGAIVVNWDLPAVDITDIQCVEYNEAAVESEIGVPYGLVNNAAVDFPPGSGADPFRNLEETLAVNLIGAVNCCKVVGSAMTSHNRGHIVNIGSIYGINGPDQSIYQNDFIKPLAYTASKAGLMGVTKYLATLWGRYGVQVNQLTLGGVFSGQSRKFVFNYIQKVPLCRMGEVEEYNGAVHFLLSDASAYMTGANLVIDGGYSAW